MNVHSVFSRRRSLALAAGLVCGLLLLYALVGALLLPWFAKRELPRIAAEKLGAQARASKITFNPFTLRLRVTGFDLEDKSGHPLLRIDEVETALEWRSLVRRTWMLSELRLRAPLARLEISEQGELNFATLGTGSGGGGRDKRMPRVFVGDVTVDNGRIDFEDRREKYKNSFENLSLKLHSVSTGGNDSGSYDLAAHTADGGALRWQGKISIAPLSLSGTFLIEHGDLPQLNPYLDDFSRARVTGGRVRIELPHHFALVAGKPQLTVKDAKLSVEGLALAAPDTDKPFATVDRLALEGIAADFQAHHASVRALRIAGFSVAARRDAEGSLDLARLLPSTRNDEAKTGWKFGLEETELSGGTASLADDASGLALKLEGVTAKLARISSDAAQPRAFEVAAQLEGGGRISARGKTGGTDAIEAHVEASGVPIALLQPLVGRHADIKLASGSIAIAGDLRAGGAAHAGRGENARMTYSGTAALEGVAIRDGAGAPLIEWNALATKSLRLSLGPNRARIDDLRWVAPKGKLEIAADGTTNVGRIFETSHEAAPPAAAASPEASAPQSAVPPDSDAGGESDRPDEAGEFAVRVRRVQVEHGTLDFADRSLSPNFSAVIHELAGTVNGISTDRNTRSQLSLEGQVNQFGYARLSGTINPFAPRSRTDLRVQFRNVDITSVSPYTIKFAGYRVASGRMSLDLAYRVNDNRLEGDNRIVLDGFTLGERVGTDAPKVPLELAVSLLKDANGHIDIGVPISGSLDDPNFKLGDLFWKALGNVIRKIVAAPFLALGHLFGGGGEQLASIAFEPGASRLLPPEREKFKRIADGLAKRPDLKVVIPARYDSKADGAALRREALRRELGRRAGFDIGVDETAGPVSIEDGRTRRALRELFAERFSSDELDRLKSEAERKAVGGKSGDLSLGARFRNFVSGEPQVADPSDFYRTLFRRLLEAQPLDKDALTALAQKRADAIASAMQAAGIDPARITRSNAEPTANSDAKQVTLQLGLAPAH